MSALHELAEALGIVPAYHDLSGTLRPAADETRIAIIKAMGIDASTESRAAEALRALRSWDSDRPIEPVCVVEETDPGAHLLIVNGLHGPWHLDIHRDAEGDDPSVSHPERAQRVEGSSQASPHTETISFHDIPLPTGYYTLILTFGSTSASQTRIIVPSRCTTPADLLGDRKAFGLTTNLYTIRSARNWGIGDLTDLADLAEWAGSIDAAFVGTNPLHALLNRGHDISPYSPTSRIFRNPIYMDVDALARLYPDPVVDAVIAAPELRHRLDALRDEPQVDYDQVMAVKGIVLDAIRDVFARTIRGSDSPRARAYVDYRTAHDPALTRFATNMVIGEGWAANSHTHASFDWRSWDPALRRWDSPQVRHFQQEHAERIDYHSWVQFELDQQLRLAAERAKAAGLAIGLYQDLAIGSAPGGADGWSYPDLFVNGASVGAPPDPYAAAGQNWGLPPIDPRALREDHYRYVTQLLRAAFRHSGALRIDHVMGLFRQFWIPDGMTGAQGAYVRYPAKDLLGILALESQRQRAIVVGEDLGTVPDEVRPALEKWGILSSTVLFFERNGDDFKPADEYPRNTLATANTHDMVPLAGYETGRDIELREQVGLSQRSSRQSAFETRAREIHLLTAILRQTPLMTPRAQYTGTGLRAAVHEFIGRTPSVLSAISFDDLSGETEPVNIPGVTADRYPSWRRKMRLTLGELTRSDEVRELLARGRRA